MSAPSKQTLRSGRLARHAHVIGPIAIGFLVDDLEAALEELRARGVQTDDEISSNAVSRYAHFTAPDGRLYELVERLDGDGSSHQT